MGQKLDLDGKRFGKLVATNQLKRRNDRTLRLCMCDCGNEQWVLTYSLLHNHTRSCGCARSLAHGRAARNSLLLDYQHGARKRDLDWLLSDEDFDRLTQGMCHYCGRAPRSIKSKKPYNGDYLYNGIDRVDNDLGYTTDNAVTCCCICNNAKKDLSVEEFMEWIRDICEKQHERL